MPSSLDSPTPPRACALQRGEPAVATQRRSEAAAARALSPCEGAERDEGLQADSVTSRRIEPPCLRILLLPSGAAPGCAGLGRAVPGCAHGPRSGASLGRPAGRARLPHRHPPPGTHPGVPIRYASHNKKFVWPAKFCLTLTGCCGWALRAGRVALSGVCGRAVKMDGVCEGAGGGWRGGAFLAPFDGSIRPSVFWQSHAVPRHLLEMEWGFCILLPLCLWSANLLCQSAVPSVRLSVLPSDGQPPQQPPRRAREDTQGWNYWIT